MDVDNNGTDAPSAGGDIEIEQSLLQQFSCMGTTDRDELIAQLQKVLGSNLNYSAAAFFLDMNNWNLQAAICSYFDVENPSKLPSMSLSSDPKASENENIEPNVRFQKTWLVFNNGLEEWPIGCYAQCAAGDPLGGERQAVQQAVGPGESYTFCVEMQSPATPGTYQSKWRLCTPNGCYFGDPMWAIITVVEEGTMALTDQLSHFSDLGSPLPQTVVALNPFRTPESAQNNDHHFW